MAGSWPPDNFPDLKSPDYKVTSPATRRYNCLAWAAGETGRRWEPDPLGIYYWPPRVPRVRTMGAVVAAYGSLGFSLCFSAALEAGVEKVALFGVSRGETVIPTHAAVQLESGQWSSKIGDFEDISHSAVEAVSGPIYGKVICFLQRPRPNPMPPILQSRLG